MPQHALLSLVARHPSQGMSVALLKKGNAANDLSRFFLGVGRVFVLLALAASSYAQVPTASELLSSASLALKTVPHRGRFSLEYDGKLTSFRYEQRIHGDEKYEQLWRESGEDLGVDRVSRASCGTIGSVLLNGARLTAANGSRFALGNHYDMQVVGRDRVAARNAWVVRLYPKDEYRYGASFAIDAETSLLLRHVVFDAEKNIALERIQFSSLTPTEESADSNVQNADNAGLDEEVPSGHLLRAGRPRCLGAEPGAGRSPWRPAWLPPGFLLSGYVYSDTDGHIETFTDGLSSFSVFVSPAKPSKGERAHATQGMLSRGATNALLSVMPYGEDLLSVSVIGDIPRPVAQRVTLSITQVQDSLNSSVPSSTPISTKSSAQTQ